MASTMPVPPPPPLNESMGLERPALTPPPQDAPTSREGEGKEEETAAPSAPLPTTHHNGLTDQTSYLPTRAIIVVFMAMQLAVALSFLDQSIVATALPNISAAFNSGRSSSWVASAYLLTSTACQPIWGRVSDVFGRKYTLLACVTVFWIGSLACAVAQSMVQLIVFRGLQGAGGGGLLTLVLIITSDVVSLQERGKYQGLTEATIAIANGIGPVLGGVLSEKVDWRWCFWINLPIGALAFAVIAFCLPLKAVHGDIKKKLMQIDYGGAVLTLGGTTLVLLPINWGGTSFAWSSPTVIGCLCGGVATFVLFFWWESKKAKIPIVPPFIFKVPTVACIFFNTALSGATVLTQLFYIPQYLQIVRGASAIRSGVLVLPLLLFTTFFVFVCGQQLARTGNYKVPIVFGYSLWCIALGLLSTLDQNTSTAKLIGFLILTGTGQGQTLQTSMVAAQAAVQRSEMSVVTSTRNFLRALGGTIALAFAAAIINNILRSNLLSLGFDSSVISAVIDDPTAIWRSTTTTGSVLLDLSDDQKARIISSYVKGFRTLFLVFVGLIGINAILALIFIKSISLKRDDEEELKAKGKAWIQAKADKAAKKKGGASGRDVEKGESSEEGQETTVVDAEHQHAKK